jgi:hypothetical protein
LFHTFCGESLSKERVFHISLLTEDREISCLLDAEAIGPRLAKEIVLRVNVRDRFGPILFVRTSERSPGDLKKAYGVVRNSSILNVLLLFIRISFKIVEKIFRPMGCRAYRRQT